MDFRHAPGTTPLDPDEAVGLIPRHIVTQGELNEWEQTNILEGAQWALRRKKRELLDEAFIRELHRRMFDKTWKWAGNFRQTDKNIGVDWRQIAVQLKNLLDDVKAQITFQTYPVDELALRFHHRLVWIHVFANGNGRHARLMTDLLMQRLGQPALTWGGGSLLTAGDTRKAYLGALRAADGRDYQPLLKFARGC